MFIVYLHFYGAFHGVFTLLWSFWLGLFKYGHNFSSVFLYQSFQRGWLYFFEGDFFLRNMIQFLIQFVKLKSVHLQSNIISILSSKDKVSSGFFQSAFTSCPILLFFKLLLETGNFCKAFKIGSNANHK